VQGVDPKDPGDEVDYDTLALCSSRWNRGADRPRAPAKTVMWMVETRTSEPTGT